MGFTTCPRLLIYAHLATTQHLLACSYMLSSPGFMDLSAQHTSQDSYPHMLNSNAQLTAINGAHLTTQNMTPLLANTKECDVAVLKLSIFFIVSDSVSNKFDFKKSIGFDIEKIWYLKKSWIRYRRNLVSEKFRFCSKFGYFG